MRFFSACQGGVPRLAGGRRLSRELREEIRGLERMGSITGLRIWLSWGDAPSFDIPPFQGEEVL